MVARIDRAAGRVAALVERRAGDRMATIVLGRDVTLDRVDDVVRLAIAEGRKRGYSRFLILSEMIDDDAAWSRHYMPGGPGNRG